MSRAYVYTDRRTAAVLFIVEADDVLTANSLVTAHAVRNRIERIKLTDMDISVHTIIKEKVNEPRS